MQYAHRNMLVSATANGDAVTYEYDGFGRRVKKVIAGDERQFFYDGNRLTSCLDSNGTETFFLYDAQGVYGFYQNGDLYLFGKNMLGDVCSIHLVNNSGMQRIASYTYDAWGVCTVQPATTDSDQLQVALSNPFRYRGYYYDTELGLYWLTTRHYDPKVGRFLTQDSFDYLDHENLGGLNLYAYCLNNPVNRVDLTCMRTA